MERGKLKMFGDVEDVVSEYDRHMNPPLPKHKGPSHTNIYFCHSPITYELTRSRAIAHMETERHVFISARECYPPESYFHIKDDQLGSRDALLSFAQNFQFLLNGLSEPGHHLHLYLPHVGSLAFRLMRLDPRIEQIFLIEEGTMYYLDGLDGRRFGPFDYLERLGLSDSDIYELSERLSTSTDLVTRALRGDYFQFDNWDAKIKGALLYGEDALQSLSYREALTVEMVRLERRPMASLEDVILFLLPSHIHQLRAKGITVEKTSEKVMSVLVQLSALASTIAVKFHPSDSQLKNRLIAKYRQNPNVKLFEELDLGTKFLDNGFQFEPATLGFKAFYVGESSTRIYVDKIWGSDRIIDKQSIF
jgi:hypothetical protein